MPDTVLSGGAILVNKIKKISTFMEFTVRLGKRENKYTAQVIIHKH